MNKSDIVNLIAHQCRISENRAQNIVDTIFDSIKEAIVSGGRVELRGLGCFSVKECGGYEGRNPRSGEIVDVKEKRKLVFKAGKDISDRINFSY